MKMRVTVCEICCLSGPRLGDFHVLSLILTTLKVDHLGPFIHDHTRNQPQNSAMKLVILLLRSETLWGRIWKEHPGDY